MLKLWLDGVGYKIETFTFSGGEEFVKVGGIGGFKYKNAHISAYINSSSEFIKLLSLLYILKNRQVESTHLYIPYLPYARQDRIMEAGQANQLKMVGSILNSFNISSVVVDDVHSSVAESCIDNLVNRELHSLILEEKSRYLELFEYEVVIAPDVGALKRASGVAKLLACEVVTAYKNRDISTGNILETKVLCNRVEIEDKKVLVVDDICDGGRTFTELAKVVKEYNPQSLSLLVTHGIFSKGKEVLEPYFDKIYSIHDWKQEKTSNGFN